MRNRTKGWVLLAALWGIVLFLIGVRAGLYDAFKVFAGALFAYGIMQAIYWIATDGEE